MKKRIKQIIGVIIGIIIGISTTVGATTIFNSKDITYSSDKTSKTNVKDSLDELYTNLGKCPNNKSCVDKKISEIVELGDYIRMTPTSTSYTPPGELTGCMNDANCTQNTLNPSELNLWRVIKKNDDGTIEMVSEYVSSKTVSFYGKTGFINLVGGLNTIAAQYTNSKYVQNTRHIGYSNQTENLTDTSKLDQTTAPWNSRTSDPEIWIGCDRDSYLCGKDEDKGAGDIGYETDYNLINTVLGTMVGKSPNGEALLYWLASREFAIEGADINMNFYFCGRGVTEEGSIRPWSNGLIGWRNKSESKWTHGRSIRPILTIKSNVLLVSGDGKSIDTAYVFE